MMLLNNLTWKCVQDRLGAGSAVPDQVGAYLRGAGWTFDSADRVWRTTVDGAKAWLLDIPDDPNIGIPFLPDPRINGLVQARVAWLQDERRTKVVTTLLRLEVVEDRNWPIMWADIVGGLDGPAPATVTLRRQAEQIASDLDGFSVSTGVRDSHTGEWWPWVDLDLDDITGLRARPTLPSELPVGMTAGNCWTIDVSCAPTLTAFTGGRTAAYLPTAFTAGALRTLADRARATV
ncbi:hypothetical protein ACWDUL_33800 [Nocardia niigatensis]